MERNRADEIRFREHFDDNLLKILGGFLLFGFGNQRDKRRTTDPSVFPRGGFNLKRLLQSGRSLQQLQRRFRGSHLRQFPDQHLLMFGHVYFHVVLVHIDLLGGRIQIVPP
jgi:hypothetical protein